MSVSAVSYKLCCFMQELRQMFLLYTLQEPVTVSREQILLRISTDSTSPIKDFCIFRNSYTCKFCDFICRLCPTIFAIKSSVDDDCLYEPYQALFQVSGSSSLVSANSFFACSYTLIQNSNRLLGSTDHTIIKCFRMDNRVNSHSYICCVINDNRCISGANAKSRFS